MTRFLLGFLFGLAAWTQVVPDQYIVELSSQPVARRMAARGRRVARIETMRADRDFTAEMNSVRRQQAVVRRALEQSGAEVLDSFQIVHNAFVVRVPEAQLPQLRTLAGVKAVRPVRLYYPVLDHAVPLQKVNDAWAQVGGMEKAGLGAKIAIIDTGIDNTHPAFTGSSLPVPDGFPKTNRDSDNVFATGKIIVARAYNDTNGDPYPAKDIDGHGTSVAMIAAGWTNTGPHGPLTGIAPQAYLGSYKVFPDGGSGAPDSVIIRALEDAVSDGMDVLNLSLGGFPALRPDMDELAQAVENAVAAGKVVVVAAGNNGSGLNTIASPGTAPSAIAVGSSLNDRVFAVQAHVDGGKSYGGLPGGTSSDVPIAGPVADVSQLDGDGMACNSFPAGSLNGAVALILRGVCTFEVKLNNAQSAGAVAAIVYTDETRPDAVGMATGSATLPGIMLSYADGVDLKSTLKPDASVTVTIDFALKPLSVDAHKISSFSSRGPSADYAIKPDLLAVGSDIYTASPSASDGTAGYTVGSGTSFSTPMVSGAAAVLEAARPGLSPAQYRSLLANTCSALADKDPVRVQMTGGGVLNLANALQSTVTAVPSSLSFGVAGSSASEDRTITLTNVGKVADTFSVSVASGDPVLASTSTNSLTLKPGESAPVPVHFSTGGLAGGGYQGYIQVQGTQSPVVSLIPYWYGVPSESPAAVQVLVTPTNGRILRQGRVYFRMIDAAGLPVTTGVDTSVATSNDMQIDSVDSDDTEIPGSFFVTVHYGATRGTQTLHIELSGVGVDVPITVR